MESRDMNIKNKEIDLSMIEEALLPNVDDAEALSVQLMPDKPY
ncbi:hypothetical protein ACTFRO_11650 [Bacillus cereus group sp. MYBK163-2]|uniref:Uncharacterized protein n=1 Tax=Bacillus cereus VD196 TaxID=1053243 RepID=A0A9W5Q1B2_BACCE|nr:MULTISPECIES: hypothetical protein [Bacillus cereus group]EOO64596.1 hypothetical protein IKE_04136 [Bacillus cereus VD196]MCU5079043.1 hypothetical protein [Bacillus cereus]MDA2253829.1 hypothetical protein [Bacillus cereus]MDA2506162.1 hypothetical protein [Bacillus cereus]MDZ4484813.1 hypothetical protein [Bacillus cereus]